METLISFHCFIFFISFSSLSYNYMIYLSFFVFLFSFRLFTFQFLFVWTTFTYISSIEWNPLAYRFSSATIAASIYWLIARRAPQWETTDLATEFDSNNPRWAWLESHRGRHESHHSNEWPSSIVPLRHFNPMYSTHRWCPTVTRREKYGTQRAATKVWLIVVWTPVEKKATRIGCAKIDRNAK